MEQYKQNEKSRIKMKLLCIGDMHFKNKLGYSDYVKDGRNQEKQEVLDFIVDQSKDCNNIIFMGDCLDHRHNPSNVIKDFTAFLKRFGNKQLLITAGNHEKLSNSDSALDFLSELSEYTNWNILTKAQEKITFNDGVSDYLTAIFCPYFYKQELQAKTKEEATQKLLEKLEPAELIFHHHAVSTDINTEYMANFDEIILPLSELKKKYKISISGHIHQSTFTPDDGLIVTGSVFCDEVNETEKYIYKITIDYDKYTPYDSTRSITYEQIKLPNHPIIRLINPTQEDMEKIDPSSIVKFVITDKQYKDNLKEEVLSKLYGYVITEAYKRERKQNTTSDNTNILDLNLQDLLVEYSKVKNVDLKALQQGFELINNQK